MIQLLLNKICKRLFVPRVGIYTFLNPYSYLLARRNKFIYDQFDGIFIDGILLIKLIRLVFKRNIERVSFDMTSLAPRVFSHCIENNRSIAFVGTTDKNLLAFIKQITTDFNELNIVYSRNGYLGEEYNKTILEIIDVNPDVIIVGMGTPLQDKFLIDLKRNGYNGAGFTCGGFIHQSSKNLTYYPTIFDELNLRWLYRMIKEKNTIIRYLFYYPISILLFLKDVFFFRVASK